MDFNNLYSKTDETGGSEINEAVSKTTFADKSSFFEQQISMLLELTQTGKQQELSTDVLGISHLQRFFGTVSCKSLPGE